jgi:hypothetical protein
MVKRETGMEGVKLRDYPISLEIVIDQVEEFPEMK